MLPGDRLTMPIVRVTNEHRTRWPEEYLKFKDSQSLSTKVRLWWQRRKDRSYRARPPDVSLDVAFQTMVEAQRRAHQFIDGTAGDDLRAVLAASEAAAK